GQRLPRQDVGPDDHGIDAGAEIVDVRDGDDAHTAPAERVDRPGPTQRPEEIAVPWCVERDVPSSVTEELARGVEAQRHELVERERVAQAKLADVLADCVVCREARHQRNRYGRAECLLERTGLRELRLEEALSVYRLEHGLHDTAEPRRHSAGE